MILKNRIVFLLFFLYQAGEAQFIFTNLQKRNGLSSGEVTCSYKDGEGFVWFGTSNGLNRYDGSGFKVYKRHDRNAKFSPALDVRAICGYSRDELLVGSTKGLLVYDKIADSFSVIAFKGVKTEPAVAKMFYDARSVLWVLTGNGIFIVKNGQAIPASEVYTSLSALKGSVIFGGALVGDSIRNGLWIGTTDGLFFLNFETGGLISKNNNPDRLSIFDNGIVYALAIEKKGSIWLCSKNNPLVKFYFSTNKNEVHDIGIDNIHYSMFVDSRNRLWLSNYSGKIQVIDSTGKVNMLPDGSPDSYSICNNIFSSISEDNFGNLWITGPNGISKLAANSYLQNIISVPANLFNNTSNTYLVNTICHAAKDALWICKDDGLCLYNTKTGAVKAYSISKEILKPNRFFDIKFINGEWWCATGDGIKILNPSTNQFHAFAYMLAQYPLKNISCTWLYQDRRGMIWFSYWGKAVFRFDPVTKQTVRIEELRSTEPSNPILTNSLCVFENTDGKIWFGNGERGVKIYDPVTGIFVSPRGLENKIVHKICRDANNNLWLATIGEGILKTDASGNILDSITFNNGLTTSYVRDIDFDKQGVLWATGGDGIQYVNAKTKSVITLDVDMGTPVHEANGALYIEDSLLYAGTANKIAIINIAGVGKTARLEPPLVSEVKVFGKEVSFSGLQPSLRLNYKQNFFTIEFSSIWHRDIPSLQYAYRLKGVDKDWVYCGRRQFASYTNVSNGHYVFLVKCSNANGDWLDNVRSFDIIIESPFWKTWWFISALLLLLFLAGWKLYRIVLQRRQRQYIDTAIDYFANSVYVGDSVDEICWDIARNCISQMHFEDCVVYLLDNEKNKLVQKAAYGPKNPRGHEIVNPIEIEPGKGIVGTVLMTGKPLLVEDTTKDARYIVDDERRFSELAVPVMHDGKVIGIIDSEHSQKNYFTENHLKALSTIAAISANKIAEATAGAIMRENEIKVLEINKMLAESQLMALRAQMNPHFVFNCLNSIQECIVTEKYGEASRYLNKFSKLFRMVLNNSGKKMVNLSEEKEVLALYLELEQMRFEKSFEYTIDIDENLDADEILIPSMLVQPYVENALWHGLMHQEGERTLSVKFRLINENVFECIVDDNGIGRKKSFELKAGQSKSKYHESRGLAISKDRLEMLQRQGYHSSLQMIDKYDTNGKATGTTIIIQLSTELLN